MPSIYGFENGMEERDRIAEGLTRQETKEGREIAAEIQREIVENQKSIQTTSVAPQITSSESEIIGSGSGFIVTTSGYILTCYHVVNQANEIKVIAGDKKYFAQLIRADKHNDLALLKIEGRFSALAFAPRHAVEMGSDVFTIGYPNPILQGVNQKLTEGNISSLTGFQDDIRLYQISTPVQPGNSGGPLMDNNGNVVGVLVSILNAEATFQITGNLPQNVNYALKTNYAMSVIDTVPEAYKGLLQPYGKQKFEKVVERVKKSVVMILAYE